ncbi:MAG TPA: aminoacyl-tRNA hydrolase [Candidatus Brocadiia bacterium]|nr:aminoacyl-tRNA hydrolase [Candidatus Brocadiia bacterium]
MKVIVGLGNPGAQYAETRHNVGFRTIDALAGRLRASGPREQSRGLVYRAATANGKLVLAKPLTYVNLSGECVAGILDETGCSRDELLVICDDLALPLGAMRVRPKGGAGGHKGLLSIEGALGAQDYPRLRLGIGPLPEGVIAKDFVLDAFRNGEREEIERSIALAADAAEAWAREGIDECMNRFN